MRCIVNFLLTDRRILLNTFLGEFVKLRKTTISFVTVRLSVRQSVGMEQLGFHWMDYHEIWCLVVFRKYI
jgi:hypothetical protein